ncbi:hypothetical protein N864_14740 [Intrasporangium chromatireducens Q5-1]|uniref:DUF3152 domain-containing protein n=1 Tax=Intrasporangium chromatireducens Q5-1 TaxID=584657 RepID=W9GM50_9MICO|nr:DUF3152 domain-containing protein [Intrasporangium chromatireducens]EWT05908.1 hypothetical protein N864_14740 [Intrasporangium chromatireducens Q5-1]
MSTRATHRRERVAARRRSVAAAAVLACVVADVWAVASGAAGQGTGSVPASAVSTLLSVGTRAGALPPTAAVRSAMTDTSEPGRGTDSTPPASATPTVVPRGDGKFTVLAVPAGATGPAPASGRTVRYTVETEGGLGVDTRDYATTVARVLNDQRGWETQDKVRFVNVTPAQVQRGDQVDIRVTLASPDTTDKLCAPLETRGRVSCFANGRAVLNAKRWLLGVEEAYGKDVATYRIYQVNHEVGHGIGHGHASCPGKNKPAPVMMQQTYGLDGCSPWPWPTAKPV